MTHESGHAEADAAHPTRDGQAFPHQARLPHHTVTHEESLSCRDTILYRCRHLSTCHGKDGHVGCSKSRASIAAALLAASCTPHRLLIADTLVLHWLLLSPALGIDNLDMCLQALWALASVCKSTLPSRKEAASAIVSSAKKHHAERGDASGQRIFLQFASMSDQLYKLCHHNTSGCEEAPGRSCASYLLTAER